MRTIWLNSYDTTAELQDLSKYHPVVYRENLVVRYVRCVLVFVGSPSFAGLKLRVYGNNQQNNTPSALLKESINSWQSAEIYELGNGWKDVWFKFNDFQVKENNRYNFVLHADSYTPSVSSFLGLELAWPNPIQKKGFTPNSVNLLSSPYKIYAIGDNL